MEKYLSVERHLTHCCRSVRLTQTHRAIKLSPVATIPIKTQQIDPITQNFTCPTTRDITTNWAPPPRISLVRLLTIGEALSNSSGVYLTLSQLSNIEIINFHFTSFFQLTTQIKVDFRIRVRVRVCNAAFNTISVISWRSVLLVEETGVPIENHRPVASH